MATENDEPISFWNVNLPSSQWTDKCPDYLLEVDERDRAQLSVRDEDYSVMTWPEVKELIDGNRLDAFLRIPSDLHGYRRFIAQCKASHGSVLNYILKERLGWSDLTPKAGPFEDPDDIKILRNDWPYGIDRRIVHLVVWTKFDFEEEPEKGDLTAKARKQVEDYVRKIFQQHENPNHIVWFKNWTTLKSIHAVEHFHVMLFDPDPDFVCKVTGGDVALHMKQSSKE